jgi:hypothetical protein
MPLDALAIKRKRAELARPEAEPALFVSMTEATIPGGANFVRSNVIVLQGVRDDHIA